VTLPTLRPTGRPGDAIGFDRDPAGSRTGLAGDALAALADMAGAATARAGLFHDRSGAVVVHRKPSAEEHANIPWFCANFCQRTATLSTVREGPAARLRKIGYKAAGSCSSWPDLICNSAGRLASYKTAGSRNASAIAGVNPPSRPGD
jgi:hypothetical protein